MMKREADEDENEEENDDDYEEVEEETDEDDVVVEKMILRILKDGVMRNLRIILIIRNLMEMRKKGRKLLKKILKFFGGFSRFG